MLPTGACQTDKKITFLRWVCITAAPFFCRTHTPTSRWESRTPACSQSTPKESSSRRKPKLTSPRMYSDRSLVFTNLFDVKGFYHVCVCMCVLQVQPPQWVGGACLPSDLYWGQLVCFAVPWIQHRVILAGSSSTTGPGCIAVDMRNPIFQTFLHTCSNLGSWKCSWYVDWRSFHCSSRWKKFHQLQTFISEVHITASMSWLQLSHIILLFLHENPPAIILNKMP